MSWLDFVESFVCVVSATVCVVCPLFEAHAPGSGDVESNNAGGRPMVQSVGCSQHIHRETGRVQGWG